MASIRIALVVLVVLGGISSTRAQNAPASQPAKVQPVDYQALKALMPAQAVGVARSSNEGQNIALGEMVMSKANAEYIRPNADDKAAHATIEITDFGASPQMLAGMAAWRSIPMRIENDQGYQRTVKFKDYPAFQIYTKDGESRQMMLVVAERYLVNLQTYYISEPDFTRFAEGLPWDQLAALK